MVKRNAWLPTTKTSYESIGNFFYCGCTTHSAFTMWSRRLQWFVRHTHHEIKVYFFHFPTAFAPAWQLEELKKRCLLLLSAASCLSDLWLLFVSDARNSYMLHCRRQIKINSLVVGTHCVIKLFFFRGRNSAFEPNDGVMLLFPLNRHHRHRLALGYCSA